MNWSDMSGGQARLQGLGQLRKAAFGRTVRGKAGRGVAVRPSAIHVEYEPPGTLLPHHLDGLQSGHVLAARMQACACDMGMLACLHAHAHVRMIASSQGIP